MGSRTLIVFAKAPKVGRVKSRLARDIGYLGATLWYRRQLAGLLRELGDDRRWRCHLFVSPRTAVRAWPWPSGWRIHGQADGDLGQRMLAALRRFGTGQAVLIGSDIPGIGRRQVADAFKALGRNKAVFGPAEDGGYWLVGFAPGYRADPFRRVRWSSAHALADTLAGFRPGTRIGLLQVLRDVDEAADLDRLPPPLSPSGRTARAPGAAA